MKNRLAPQAGRPFAPTGRRTLQRLEDKQQLQGFAALIAEQQETNRLLRQLLDAVNERR